jgi:signal transduction histidine kinase
MLEAENLVERVVVTMTLMLLMLIIAMYFLNQYIFRKIWDEFFYSINKVKNFNFKDNPDLNLPESEVEEFQMLNDVFEKLTARIHQDYINLKEFTENASHEIQTPLSIMRAKIELLLQQPGYSKEQIELISALNVSVTRLSNINKVLTLLTRIENNQFPEISKVDMLERTQYHLENFEELINEKRLTVNTELNQSVSLGMNIALTDILIINLIKNAIRHNFDDGTLNISLSERSLTVSNTGPKPEVPPDQLFNRFVHSQHSSESLGLGLSLVKKICELYNFEIVYRYENDLNMIEIIF